MEGPITLIKSPSDHREYRAITLPSGLRAILIRDPQIECQTMPTSTHGTLNHGEAHPEGHHIDDALPSDDMASSLDDSGSEEESEGSCVCPSHLREIHTGSGVKKAAAALSVGIGHYSDPEHLQGLSHYLEHMVFMGSEKYPDENDYDAYLSSNSGASNACTEEEATTFHFDCAPAALEGALDRFAQFFVAPLIKSDAMEREVQAVDSEFAGVMQSDSCRLSQLRAHTSRPGHPACKFGWGNVKSLVEYPSKAGVDVRAMLLDHYRTHYSAERMNLVVLGGEPLTALETWVREKFAAVPHGRGPRPAYTSTGFPFAVDDACGSLYVLPAVRDAHTLSAVFQLPSLEKQYGKKGEEYLSHLIGHEGRGSLLSGLKSRGWATELCAGIIDQTSAAWLFEISITLTEAGLTAGPGCGIAAAELLFEYIAMLRSQGPQKWAWDELATIAEMKWRFLEEEDAADYAAQLASDMHMYPLHHVLIGGYLYQEFDPGLIGSLLDGMVPTAVRLDLQTKSYADCLSQLEQAEGFVGNIQLGEEPWFQLPYAKVRLPGVVLEAWSAFTELPPDLALPARNPYLPSDFGLKCDADQAQQRQGIDSTRAEDGQGPDANELLFLPAHPQAGAFPSPPSIVLDRWGLRIWHKLDRTFRVPRAFAFFRLTLPEAYKTPRAAVMTHLVVKILEDALCQEAYLADVAGLHYNIAFEGSLGIDIKVDGFSDKLPVLTALIFRTLAALRFTDEDWVRIHEALLRSYRNAHVKPMKQATYLRLMLLKKDFWDITSMITELESIKQADVRSFLGADRSDPLLLSSARVDALIMGNVTAEDAVKIGQGACSLLGADGLQGLGDRTRRIPGATCWVVGEAAFNPEEDNSVVEIYYQCRSARNPHARALVDMVDQLVYEPFYDTLRTKEQLGYTVASGTRLTHGVLGLCVIIQSGTHGPSYLDQRVDAFFTLFSERLQNMTVDEFEKNRQALLSNKLMKERNLGEEADRAWDAAVNRGQDFMSRRDDVEALMALTHADVVEFYNATFVPGGTHWRKLAVHVAGRGHRDDVLAGKGKIEIVSMVPAKTEMVGDIKDFKAEGLRNVEELYFPVVPDN